MCIRDRLSDLKEKKAALFKALEQAKEPTIPEPVSYTHLDVYKRQALPFGGACGICAAAMTAFSRQSEGGPMQTINLKQYYPCLLYTSRCV